MSYITHTGYGYSQKHCEDTTSWFLNTFFPRHLIDIHVVHRGLKREDSYGWCDVTGRKSRPRDFQIEMQSNMQTELYTKTLLHELTHVGQWVKGTLRFKSGKMYFNEEKVDHTDYHSQPHEIEAFAQEEILYRRYMKERFDVTVQEPIQYFPNRLLASV